MMKQLSRLTAERDSLTTTATGLVDKAADEDRDLTPAERTRLGELSARCAEIDADLVQFSGEADSIRAYGKMRESLAASPTVIREREAAAPAPAGWGDLFVTSDAFREYPGAGASRRLEVPFDLEARAAIMVGNMPAGTIPPYTYTPASFAYASPLLDVVGKVTTSSQAVQWVTWAPNPQAAAPVVPEGELKPEAVMTPTIVSDTLDTYAHHKAISRQALEDIPQIRSIVEGRLRQGITVALEEAVTAALLAAPIPASTVPLGGSLLEAIRSGVATVQAAGYGNPNAVLLNPADWADLDVATIGNGGGASGQTGFWGMRAVSVPALPAGTAYVGNFQTAVQLFTRSSAEVFMTDSHADYFVRNLLLLLAEIRALATVPDPAAAAECSVAIAGTAAAKK
jgi:HK97 family phage major capsid protein